MGSAWLLGRSQTRLKISVPEPESRGRETNRGSQEGAGLSRASMERTTQLLLCGELNQSRQEWAGQPAGRPLLTWSEFGVLPPEEWWRDVFRPGACLGGGRHWTWGEAGVEGEAGCNRGPTPLGYHKGPC